MTAGATVLVTRAREDCAPLEALLRERGLRPIALPCIELQTLDAHVPADVDFVVVASPHAARLLAPHLPRLSHARFAAVGAGTAECLPLPGVIVPASGTGADALVAALGPLVRGKRVLLPRAEQGNPALPAQLQALGAEVVPVALYRTVTAGAADPAVLAELHAGRIDAISFASGSAARGFVALATAQAAARSVVVCMGALCASEARRAGLRVDGESGGGLAELAGFVARALAGRPAAGDAHRE